MAKIRIVTYRTKKLSVVMSTITSCFHADKAFLFLGEIPNMPGHCAVVDKKGSVLWGYHFDNFREASEEEV